MLAITNEEYKNLYNILGKSDKIILKEILEKGFKPNYFIVN